LKVIGRSGSFTVDVVADGKGLSSRAGTAMLPLLAEQIGLTRALEDGLAHTRERRCAHPPGRVFCDLAVMLCDGGRCVSDLGALGDQTTLFGDVCSISTARRVLLDIGEAELDAIRVARARAREGAWAAGAPRARVILDFDATLVTAHSDKEHAAGNYKGGFGFHPLLATCGREALAGILRPGNAGANTAADHIDVLELALEALPQSALDGEILARADGAGASHAFAEACRETNVRFSLGFPIHEGVREAILGLPKRAWKAAIDQDGRRREGAWVAELSTKVDLSSWPTGTRLICRRERPHPGAQLSFTDIDGHRFQCFITDQGGGDIAGLEVLNRQHACVEDRIGELKATGLSKLPFGEFGPNEAWLELALTAHTLTAWTQALLLDSEHAILRAQAPALPATARRRQAHPPRPTRHAAPARRLALGRRHHARLQAPRRAPRQRLNPPPTHSTPGQRPPPQPARPPLPAKSAATARSHPERGPPASPSDSQANSPPTARFTPPRSSPRQP